MLPTIRLCQKEEEDASWDVERQVWDPFNWQADGSVGIDYDPNLHFVALEGSKVIANEAKKNFIQLRIKHSMLSM